MYILAQRMARFAGGATKNTGGTNRKHKLPVGSGIARKHRLPAALISMKSVRCHIRLLQ
ncbi:hypothetical protein GCM10011445_02940 [Pseudocitrobacter faecalis]|nr:hypothetical protein GCM10011445_02940 [Pseudocitrobacter faecalis]